MTRAEQLASEAPIWAGKALGATVEIVAGDDDWRIFEISGELRRELPREFKALVYSAAIASLASERDKLRAENEALASTIETFNRCALADKAEVEALRARFAKLERALGSLVCEDDEDLAEVLMDDRSDKLEASWQDAINEHRRRIENARAVLKGSGDGQTEAK